MTAIGSNQNKAITKRLASAGHYQQARCTQLCGLAFSIHGPVLRPGCHVSCRGSFLIASFGHACSSISAFMLSRHACETV